MGKRKRQADNRGRITSTPSILQSAAEIDITT